MSLDFDSARLPNPNLRPEHEEWRTQLRRFIDTEIMPHAEDWDEAGHIPIELWPKAAAVGLLSLLVLLGNDLYHPESSSRVLAELAGAATLIEQWKEPEHHAAAKTAVAEFLAANAR